ncbi:MAG: DUF4147 domain-containing protein [Acidobacteriota bacterium]
MQGNLGTEHREQLWKILEAALGAVRGSACVSRYLRTRELCEPVYLIAFGKAACAMARGVLEALGDRILDACVVTKHGHAEPLPWPVIEAGHPVPDEQSLEAGRRLVDFARGIPSDARVLALLSGGASAVLDLLPNGVTLADLQALNGWLLGSGLDIASMNRIRKQVSLIKGGRLARMLYPRRVLCLAISDVPGDDRRAIGSGPLVPDEDLQKPLDMAVLPEHLRTIVSRGTPAPAPDDPCFEAVEFHIVARLDDAKRAAAEAARRLGYAVEVETEFVSGDAVEAGARMAARLLRSASGVVHVWGGETTVKLPVSPGRGGRNQSLALSAARVLRGVSGVWFLAAGTDGTDGPTQDAGALVDGGTIDRGEAHGLDAADSIARADAGTFLEASGDLIRTGPTGTNVMDVFLGLREQARNG